MSNEKTSNTFQSSLSNQANHKYQEFRKSLGKAIQSTLQNYGLNSGQNLKMDYSEYWDEYGTRSRVGNTHFSKEVEMALIKEFEVKLMKDFQESLNNFAWAIQNGPGGN